MMEFLSEEEEGALTALKIKGDTVMASAWNKNSALITAFESSNKYTSNLAAPEDIVPFAKRQKLILANPPEDSYLPIEVLIGGDFYWHVVTAKSPIEVENSFVMIPSIFGWVLSGSRTHTTITHNSEEFIMFQFKALMIVWTTKCDVYGNWIPLES
ncbi:integrase catalytic domain-containing protein [Trichonephila inaurata madagascariensis]|uniref:Integrase catalytic domain-containing protein n=1 Tax=Trichonephila inaurata madagascariensis TaxID=2747483 RepID=A0A8X6J067_9ARAC|nr:integrase catalytic domain-containing protein [Trichonephila inaurata madagascariensis]